MPRPQSILRPQAKWFHNGTILDTLTAKTRMANLTIKNAPATLVRRLKRQAAVHRRSLKLEVIACLETATHAAPVDPEALLARARSVRRMPAVPRMTDAWLARQMAAGSPCTS